MKTYEIKKQYEEIFYNPEFMDPETGEITEAGELALKDNQDHKEMKCDNMGRLIANIEGESDAYKKEMDRLAKLKKWNDNKVKSIKKILTYLLDEQALNTELFKFSFRKSEKAELLDKNLLPNRFKTTETVEKIAGLPDIKKDLKTEIEARIEEAKADGKEYNEADIKMDVYSENGLNITFNSNLQIK